jgi:hypothetical protein
MWVFAKHNYFSEVALVFVFCVWGLFWFVFWLCKLIP